MKNTKEKNRQNAQSRIIQFVTEIQRVIYTMKLNFSKYLLHLSLSVILKLVITSLFCVLSCSRICSFVSLDNVGNEGIEIKHSRLSRLGRRTTKYIIVSK